MAANIQAKAEAETVEDLVRLVRKGNVRVPTFQRGLRWKGDDVVQFFDSLYRGFPVGSLLLSRGKASAAKIVVGPLSIDAPETNSALWVIDGQQRLVALTVGLSRPLPIPTTPDDPWVVYFDAREKTFREPPLDGTMPATWVPLAQLLNATSLSEWVHNWNYSSDPTLRNAVFEAGTRLRQYRIPLYIVDTTEEEALRQIFHRINTHGKRMRWNEVHDALYGDSGTHPSTLTELANELRVLGMGRPEEDQLLSSLLAYKGLDVTRSLNWHSRKNQDVLRSAVKEGLTSIRSALSFLRIHCEIPHLRLLPKATPLPVLSRFFAVYPEPNSRTLTLLTRWTWRTLVGAFRYNERTLLRRAISAIQASDEEASVQNLLALLSSERASDYSFPVQFDARSAASRIALLGLASLNPLDLDGAPIDIAQSLEEEPAFRQILPSASGLSRSAANRILLPGRGYARNDLEQYQLLLTNSVLSSHALSRDIINHLAENDLSAFFEARKRTILSAVQNLIYRLAAWEHSDRPSIEYLLQQSNGEQ